MDRIWLVYTDGYYSQYGTQYDREKNAIKIRGIFDKEIDALRFIVNNQYSHYKCKELEFGPIMNEEE